MIFLIRNGRLVPKASIAEAIADNRSDLAAPMLSRMTPFESPVTGAEITSWRDRERDMAAVDAVDPRDLPKNPKRGRAAQLKEAQDG